MRLRIPTDTETFQSNTGIQLRETDRRTAQVAQALGDVGKAYRNSWTGSGTFVPSFDDQPFTSWDEVRAEGGVYRSGGSFQLQFPGRWRISLVVYSDSASAGSWIVRVKWSAGLNAWGFSGPLESGGYRGGGFNTAGYRRDIIANVVVADASDIGSSLSCGATWVSQIGGTNATANYTLSLDFLGGVS